MEADLTNLTRALIANCVMMINQMTARGQKPLMFIMSDGTRMAVLNSYKWNRTWWQKLLRLNRKHPALVALHGVPIVPNAYMPDGMVHLQAMPFVVPGQPGFFAPGQGFQPEALPQEQGGAPAQPGQRAETQQQAFWRRVEQPAMADPTTPTLDELATSGGKPSPTDILIKAMEDVDRVKHIAVLEIMHNNDIEAATNMDHTTLTGAIQKFHVWAMTNGER